ncbi:uncharacterized protein Dwil_GK27036 [Drosophila willistoni]|uniref:Uncharacterized protein n=1 Tax=Drosophila willistoni TaxID=7260 RepID=A0A0Q9X3E2_DROWI|nr:uncharacterized protein Dwil_GK27036 [Drosophila willistoni]
MLLTPSAAYVDLPTEMFIDIKEIDEQKLIEFDIPLPPHHCGWHTNNFIIDRAYEAYMSQPGQSQWIQMGDVMSKESVKKSNACCGGNYKIHEIDTDYSSKEPTKTNQALISWCLSDSSSSSSLKILTQMSRNQGRQGLRDLKWQQRNVEPPFRCKDDNTNRNRKHGLELENVKQPKKKWKNRSS